MHEGDQSDQVGAAVRGLEEPHERPDQIGAEMRVLKSEVQIAPHHHDGRDVENDDQGQ